ncbi:MAG: hypothetical protein DMG04_03350 [Acidobacteria bacterium]|nr:MAG: hypothetical protein DMG04_03350 [Acidobacteriota bacterium]
MIEASRAIEPRDDCRQLRAESPLVGASAGGFDLAPPSIPPARRASGHRFDDQERVATFYARDQLPEQHLACAL